MTTAAVPTRGLARLAATELRLYLREPVTVLVAVLLPAVVLLVLGAIPALRTPAPPFGGARFVDVFAPAMLAISIAMLGLQTLPTGLAAYREQGVLRRFATTPMRPPAVLAVQLVITVGMAAVSTALLVAVAHLALGVPLPQHPVGFVLAFLLGTAAVFAVGLVVAAVAPRARTATAVGSLLFVLTQFFGGVYLPKFLLPEVVVRIGRFVPPGTGAFADAWTGAGPRWAPLGAMAVIALVASVLAARLFRWDRS
jgi:ABC-2 type transport system permease protein